MRGILPVIPAEAGIHVEAGSSGKKDWIPAFAGMTTVCEATFRFVIPDLIRDPLPLFVMPAPIPFLAEHPSRLQLGS